MVGAHTAMAFLESGHELRLLVRNEKGAKDYFSKKGFSLDDFVVGDMTDKRLIKEHLSDCDGVYHGAAMVSLHPKHKKQVYESNIKSIDAVIGSAIETFLLIDKADHDLFVSIKSLINFSYSVTKSLANTLIFESVIPFLAFLPCKFSHYIIHLYETKYFFGRFIFVSPSSL